MNKLTDTLSDPTWWFTVVIAGIVINVVAAFLFRRLDRQISQFSETWRVRSERRQVARGERVALLRTHDRFLLLSLFEDMRYRSRATVFFIFGIALMTTGGLSLLPAWARALCFLLAAMTFSLGQLAAGKAAKILFEILDSGLSVPVAPAPHVGSPPDAPDGHASV